MNIGFHFLFLMGLNILDLLNQLKQFIVQEKGTYFSLLIFLLLGLTLGEWVIPFFEELGYELHKGLVYIVLLVSMVGIWLHIRRLGTKSDRINIAISQMDILNVSTTEQLNSEQKIQISTEVVNYVYNRLSHLKQSLKLDKHMHFLKLPPRLKVDYANSLTVSKKIHVDMIIWGTIRYDENMIYINTKLAFNKEISSIFFWKLIDDFNAYPELAFDFSSPENLEFDKFIHEVTYLSIIYRSLELINQMKFEEAEKVLLHGIERLNHLYDNQLDQSVNRGDKEVSKIEVLLYHVLSKNYFQRSNELLSDFDYENIANELLDKSASAIEHQLFVIKKYISDSSFSEISEKLQVENSYFYAMSKLGKTRSKKTLDKELKSIDQYVKDEHKHNMIHALIEARFENYDDAKDHYKDALASNSDNIVALRGLGLIYYSEGNFSTSREYFLKLTAITDKYIFNKYQYDVKAQKHLYLSSFKTGHIIDSLIYFWKYSMFKRKNRSMRKQMYYL